MPRSPDHRDLDELRASVVDAAPSDVLGAVNQEPDDHIGLELAFIGELCVAALRASEGGDVGGQAALVDAVARFVHDHLARWAPRLAELVVEGAQTALYRASGYLLARTVEELARLFPRSGEGQLASGA